MNTTTQDIVEAANLTDLIVQAAGTSEGAKKGWEHRSTFAFSDSQRAEHKSYEISKHKAMSYGYFLAHKDAALAHGAARKSHLEALDGASEHYTAIHQKQADYHKAKEESHWAGMKQAKDVKTNESQDMNTNKFIQCTESGVVIASDAKWEQDAPTKFQWMPGGVHTINAKFEGKPIQLTVAVDSSTAPIVQASYEDWFSIRPKQSPFGCIEHREQEAAVRLPKEVGKFEWMEASEGKDSGIYCTALPTELGAHNVNGRIFESWSPSFATDAEYEKAKTVKAASGTLFMMFPKGVRGSRENPAKVIAVAFSIGSLTNKPAFRNISPVRASEEELFDLDNSGVVQATWSDEAREAALKARQDKSKAEKHSTLTNTARSHIEAWSATSHAHDISRAAYTSGEPSHHQAAADAHSRAAELHDKVGNKEQARTHRGTAPNHRMMYYGTKASEDIAESQSIDARLAGNPEALNKFIEANAVEEDPLDSLYARLSGKSDQPAGQS